MEEGGGLDIGCWRTEGSHSKAWGGREGGREEGENKNRADAKGARGPDGNARR